MRRPLLISLLLGTLTLMTVTTFAPRVHAQRMISASPRFATGFNRGGFNHGGFNQGGFSPGGHRPSSFYSLPLYADYLSSTGYPVASQPPLIILQAPPAATAAPDRSASQSPPLMIELQGDHYVRVSGPEISGAEMIGPELIDHAVDRKTIDRDMKDREMKDRVMKDRESSNAIHPPAVPELPPAVLVFRDGHHEEASEYTIADGILYTRDDPYTGSSWNRKIELSSLNLPETIASNQSRGIRFRLPQSSNEVMVRP